MRLRPPSRAHLADRSRLLTVTRPPMRNVGEPRGCTASVDMDLLAGYLARYARDALRVGRTSDAAEDRRPAMNFRRPPARLRLPPSSGVSRLPAGWAVGRSTNLRLIGTAYRKSDRAVPDCRGGRDEQRPGRPCQGALSTIPVSVTGVSAQGPSRRRRFCSRAWWWLVRPTPPRAPHRPPPVPAASGPTARRPGVSAPALRGRRGAECSPELPPETLHGSCRRTISGDPYPIWRILQSPMPSPQRDRPGCGSSPRVVLPITH